MKTRKKLYPLLVAVKTHLAAPASTNSQGLAAKPAQEELSVICACTGPVGTGLGAVHVECGGQTCPKKNVDLRKHAQTHKQRKSSKAPYPRMRSDMKRLFFLGKTKKKRLSAARLARLIINSFVPVGVTCTVTCAMATLQLS